jgi:protease-4
VKTIQRILIATLIALPVIIGLFLSLSGDFGWEQPGSVNTLKKIGLVRIEGAIFDSYAAVEQLQSFLDDNSIAGVLLRVNSPGGATAPSQEIFREVARYKEHKKPIVVSMGSVAASGGYYISCPATTIFADPGTITGSIGVILNLPLYSELAKKIGIEMRTMKAGAHKDIASPYRKMSDVENALIQSMLDDTHDQFIGDVAYSREVPYDSIARIADGRIFTGRQAVTCHLVDTLGGYADALHYLREMVGISQKSKPVERRDRLDFFNEWLVEEIVHIFPQIAQFVTPGLQSILHVSDHIE